MHHVVIDSLHMLLRISGVLIGLFIRELKRCGVIDEKKTFPDGFFRNIWLHMKSLYKAFDKFSFPCEQANQNLGLPRCNWSRDQRS